MNIMLFSEWAVEPILAGQKTMTRRIRKKGYANGDVVHLKTAFRGLDFALVRITADERRERLQDMRMADVPRETGWTIEPDETVTEFRNSFAAKWNSINNKPGTRWEDNPLVYVEEFELIETRVQRGGEINVRWNGL